MRLRWKGTTWRVDPLMLLFPLVAALLGEGLGAGMLFGSLLIHEFAHAAAAHVLHVAMSEIRLTPFGGAARIENLYAVSAPRVFAVAAAGPAANLLALLACGAMRPLWPAAPLAELMRVNGMLMAFNLLPALPLDGGRMTYALLSAKLGRERALGACVWAGRGLAVLLAALAGWGWWARGRLNLSPLFAAVFVLSAAADERRALSESRVQSLLHAMRPLTEPREAQVVAVDASVAPEIALRCARPDRVTLYAVYQGGRLTRFTDDRALLAKLAGGEDFAAHGAKGGRSSAGSRRSFLSKGVSSGKDGRNERRQPV